MVRARYADDRPLCVADETVPSPPCVSIAQITGMRPIGISFMLG